MIYNPGLSIKKEQIIRSSTLASITQSEQNLLRHKFNKDLNNLIKEF